MLKHPEESVFQNKEGGSDVKIKKKFRPESKSERERRQVAMCGFFSCFQDYAHQVSCFFHRFRGWCVMKDTPCPPPRTSFNRVFAWLHWCTGNSCDALDRLCTESHVSFSRTTGHTAVVTQELIGCQFALPHHIKHMATWLARPKSTSLWHVGHCWMGD